MKLSTKEIVIPTKEVSITGFKDTVTIYPIGGFALMKIQSLFEKIKSSDDPSEFQEQCVRLALKWGCKCEDEDIQFLIDNDIFTCMELTKEIIEFSTEYNDLKTKESNVAKKNSKK